MMPAQSKLPISLHPELFFDSEAAAVLGSSLAETYSNAAPFAHIVLDDFLPDDLVERIHARFPEEETQHETHYERGYKGHHKRQISPGQCEPFLANLFNAFNSAPMLQFLEKLSGIQGLLPDPYFQGGGLHETKNGGFLGVHSDFRLNKRLNVERRINVIIYLNKDWRDEYAGHLELWDSAMKRCLKRVSPDYNRCVIFNTDKDSNHGHPEPLNTPEGVSRRSIALYYYTATATELTPGEKNKTDYKPRPKDRFSLTYYLRKLRKK